MTSAATVKPPAPIITRGLQLLGLGALILGGFIIADAAGCEEIGCLALPLGIVVCVWGTIALLTGIRGPIGLVFLIAAIVLPLTILWIRAMWLLVFLGVMMLLTRASKDRLAGFYRKPGGSS